MTCCLPRAVQERGLLPGVGAQKEGRRQLSNNVAAVGMSNRFTRVARDVESCRARRWGGAQAVRCVKYAVCAYVGLTSDVGHPVTCVPRVNLVKS